MVSIDITDNNIETQTAHHLDRKKRDVDDDKHDADDQSDAVDTPTTADTIYSIENSDNNDGNESNVNSKNATNTKRMVRQLRPPPPLGPQWQFGDNFELAPESRLPASAPRIHQQSGNFQRDTELSSVNFNSFLTPPGSGARSADFYKSDGAAAAAYYHQLPTSYSKQNEYNPYGNPYGNFKNPNPNTVTEFNTPKPYTVHTTFDIGDAQTQRFKPSKLVSQQPFYPLISNNGTPKSPLQSKLPQRALAGDVDSLPENFSFYHMSNGVQIKQELSHHQQEQQQQQQQQQLPKIPQPQSPVYYLDKPAKILGASTPKTHYIVSFICVIAGKLNCIVYFLHFKINLNQKMPH